MDKRDEDSMREAKRLAAERTHARQDTPSADQQQDHKK